MQQNSVSEYIRYLERRKLGFSSLSTMLPSQIVNEILAIHAPSMPNGRDTIRWAATNDRYYTTNSAYSALASGMNQNMGVWKRVRRLKVLEKIRFFL